MRVLMAQFGTAFRKPIVFDKATEFGVFDVVANFNIGRKASVLIYEKLSMIPGSYMLKCCSTLNKKILF